MPGEQLQGLYFGEQTPKAEWHLGLAPGCHVCGFTAVSVSLQEQAPWARLAETRPLSLPREGVPTMSLHPCSSVCPGPRDASPPPSIFSLVPLTVKRNNTHHGETWLGLSESRCRRPLPRNVRKCHYCHLCSSSSKSTNMEEPPCARPCAKHDHRCLEQSRFLTNVC